MRGSARHVVSFALIVSSAWIIGGPANPAQAEAPGQRVRVLTLATATAPSGAVPTSAPRDGATVRPNVQVNPAGGPGGSTVHVDGCCWTYVRPAPTVAFRDSQGTITDFGPAVLVGCHGYFQCEFALDIVIPSDAAAGVGRVRMTRGSTSTSRIASFTVT